MSTGIDHYAVTAVSGKKVACSLRAESKQTGWQLLFDELIYLGLKQLDRCLCRLYHVPCSLIFHGFTSYLEVFSRKCRNSHEGRNSLKQLFLLLLKKKAN